MEQAQNLATVKLKKYFIYLFINKINNKLYVGKTSDPKERYSRHLLIAKNKDKKNYFLIHRAINKYGADNFDFIIIDEFDDETEAYLFETWWIDYLESFRRKNGYNLNHGGKGGISPTDESIQKMIIAQNTPESLLRKKLYMIKKHEENPGFLSSVHKGNQYTKGKHLSDEHKKKISEKLTGRLCPKKPENILHGSQHGMAKLSENDVLDIRNKYALGEKRSILAKKYGVTTASIDNIVTRKSWKHI